MVCSSSITASAIQMVIQELVLKKKIVIVNKNNFAFWSAVNFWDLKSTFFVQVQKLLYLNTKLFQGLL